jgi:hypothetical protein
MKAILSLLKALPEFTSQTELAEGIDTFITPKYHKDPSKYPRILFEIGAE